MANNNPIELIKALDVYLGSIIDYKFKKYEKLFKNLISIIKGYNTNQIVGDKLWLNGLRFVKADPMKPLTKDEFYSLASSSMENEPLVNIENRVIGADLYYIYETFHLNVNDVLQTSSAPVNVKSEKQIKADFNMALLMYLEQHVNRFWKLLMFITSKILEQGYVDVNGKRFGSDSTTWIPLPNLNWSNASVDPLQDINDYILALEYYNEMTAEIDTPPPVIIMGKNAYAKFRQNPNINDKLIRLDVSSYQELLKIDSMLSRDIVYQPISLGGLRVDFYVIQGKIKDPNTGNMVDMFDPNKVVILRPLENNIIFAFGVPPMIDLNNNLKIQKDIYSIEQANPIYPSSVNIKYRFISSFTAVVSEPTMGAMFSVS